MISGAMCGPCEVVNERCEYQVGGAVEEGASVRFVDAWQRAERGDSFHERHAAFDCATFGGTRWPAYEPWQRLYNAIAATCMRTFTR